MSRFSSNNRCVIVAVLLTLVGGCGSSKPEPNHLGIKLVDIPAGQFQMGNCLGTGCDPHADQTETPRHTVTIRALQLGQTPVTLGQFKRFIDEAGRKDLLSAEFTMWNDQGDDAPVLMVNWADTKDFIDWLNKVDGGGWRLPSEAEWEYACRAGMDTRYCGGEDIEELGWIGKNSGGHQHPVAQKRPNAWGLYDMNGNGYTWLQDCVHVNYKNAPSDGSAWTGGCTDDYRMVRGGSADSYANYARATYRNYFWSDFRNTRISFRLARTTGT